MSNSNLELALVIIIILAIFTGFISFVDVGDLTDVTGRTVTISNNQCQLNNLVYKMSDLDNAHGAFFKSTNNIYNINVCTDQDDPPRDNRCVNATGQLVGPAGNVLPENAILSLSAISPEGDNAHAEAVRNHAGNQIQKNPNYQYVCFGSMSGCQLYDGSSGDPCEDLGMEYECFGSLSSETNAHVGDCNAYKENQICCVAGCIITDAYWSNNGIDPLTTNPVPDGSPVYLVVKGNQKCDQTQFVNLTIFEPDEPPLIIRRDVVEIFQNVGFINQGISRSWLAEWVCDGELLGVCTLGDPEYYFEVELGSRQPVSSSDPLLEVLEPGTQPPGCGNNIIEPGEVCDPGGPGPEDDILPGGMNFCVNHSSSFTNRPWGRSTRGERLKCAADCKVISTDDCQFLP